MYIGNDLQIAHPSYKIIDDISSGFNGSQTSFALQVSGATPVPFPISTQQVMISVNGVVQEPDPNGSAGFKLLGSNIVFSSAPANGHAFFGVINAGADYVTAGSEFPDGSATAPSFTFQDDQDTGWYRNASGDVGYSSNGSAILNFDGNGLTIAAGKGLTVDTSTFKVDAANNRVGIGLTNPQRTVHLSSNNTVLALTDTAASTDQKTKYILADAGIFAVGKLNDAYDTAVEHFRIDNDSNATFAGSVTSASLTVDTNTLHVDATNNRVGIGTTSPIEKLQATGAIISTGSNNTSSTAGANRSIIDFTSGGTRIGHFRGTTSAGSGSVKFFVDSSEKMKLDSSGRLLVGNTGVRAVAGHSPRLQLQGTEHNSQTFGIIANSADAIAATFQMSKQRSGAAGGNTIVQNGDGIADLVFTAGDGTNLDSIAAQISVKIDGTPGVNDTPGRMMFFTTPDGAQAGVERMRIDSSGKVGIGVTSPSQKLHVAGTIINSTSVNNTGDQGIQMDNGHRLGFDQSGTRSWTVKATGGNLEIGSGDGNGSLKSAASGGIEDLKGNLRRVPANTQTGGSSYSLVAADSGKAIARSGGGVTIPNSVFTTGDMVTIINNSAADITLTQGSGATMYNTADATSGNRTLAARGMCTIYFTGASSSYISGAGLS